MARMECVRKHVVQDSDWKAATGRDVRKAFDAVRADLQTLAYEPKHLYLAMAFHRGIVPGPSVWTSVRTSLVDHYHGIVYQSLFKGPIVCADCIKFGRRDTCCISEVIGQGTEAEMNVVRVLWEKLSRRYPQGNVGMYAAPRHAFDVDVEPLLGDVPEGEIRSLSRLCSLLARIKRLTFIHIPAHNLGRPSIFWIDMYCKWKLELVVHVAVDGTRNAVLVRRLQRGMPPNT